MSNREPWGKDSENVLKQVTTNLEASQQNTNSKIRILG